MRYVLAVLVGLLGIAAVVLGGLDDAPGLQLIGVTIIGAAVMLAMRGDGFQTRKRRVRRGSAL